MPSGRSPSPAPSWGPERAGAVHLDRHPPISAGVRADRFNGIAYREGVSRDAPTARPVPAPVRLWVPRQHGAWAMLALPFLVGVSVGPPAPWQVVLAVAALAGYLVAATAQAWLRARRRASFVPSLIAYGLVFAVSAAALVVAFPGLLWAAVVVVPAGAVVAAGARPGTPRDLANSFAQTAIALVLVPSAAHLSGGAELEAVVRATAVAAGYLAGTVLVVRSVLRERGNRAYAALSVSFHLALVPAATVALPWPYALCALGLAARAVALPALQRRRAGTARPLRPVHVGIVEIVASTVLVVLACFVRL